MAEKEERILVLTTHNEDGECECVTQDGFHANDSCAICNVGMTRTEAIEKMARAGWIAIVCAKNQCVPTDVTKEQWDEEWQKLRKDYKKVYYAGAEAELNALLGKE